MSYRLATCLLAMAMLAVACGGGEDEISTAPVDPIPTAEAPTDRSVDAPSEQETQSDPTPEPTPTSEPERAVAPEPTATPEPVPTPEPTPGFDLAAVPDLYERAVDAFNNPRVDPYEFAAELSGFPFEIRPPAGAALARGIQTAVNVTAFSVGGGALEWNWHYAAFGGEPFGDLVFDDEAGGPGAADVTRFFDPVLADLGFGRRASVKSSGFEADPDDPISINWVYEPATAAQQVNGASGEVINVRIWANENLANNYSDDIIAGYAIEAAANIGAGGMPVPLLASVADALPLPADAALSSAGLSLNDRGADSFAAEQGLGELAVNIELTWVTALTPEQVRDFFKNAQFGHLLLPGDIGFGDDIDPEDFENLIDSGAALVLLQRYGADLRAESDGAGTRLSLRITVEQRDVIPFAE
jgi:hypothetical protein